MMVVELMASIPPRKIQSICFHPKRCPTTMPSDIMQKMMEQQALYDQQQNGSGLPRTGAGGEKLSRSEANKQNRVENP